jgi:hypothetical protein
MKQGEVIGQPFLSFRRNLSMFAGTLFHWHSPFLILSLLLSQQVLWNSLSIQMVQL